MLNSIARKSGQAVLVVLTALVLTVLIMWAFDLPVRGAY
jgi:hypothetical protein